MIEIGTDEVFRDSWLKPYAKTTNLTFRSFATEENVDELSDMIHNTLLKAGYIFATRGATKPVDNAGFLLGFYTKKGAPEVFVTVTDPESASLAFQNNGVRSNALILLTAKPKAKTAWSGLSQLPTS